MKKKVAEGHLPNDKTGLRSRERRDMTRKASDHNTLLKKNVADGHKRIEKTGVRAGERCEMTRQAPDQNTRQSPSANEKEGGRKPPSQRQDRNKSRRETRDDKASIRPKHKAEPKCY